MSDDEENNSIDDVRRGPTDGAVSRREVRPDGRASKLAALLLAKAAVDLALVVWLAAGFMRATFAPVAEGTIELRGGELRGRFAATGDEQSADVQLFVNGMFAAARRVSCVESDCEPKRVSPLRVCEFAFELPPLTSCDSEARVYVAGAAAGDGRRVLRIVGAPVRFGAGARRADVSDVTAR